MICNIKYKVIFRIVGEWKGKVDGLGMDLDTAQKETRNVSSELFKIKNAYDESIVQLEEVRRENKVEGNLQDYHFPEKDGNGDFFFCFSNSFFILSAPVQRDQGHHGPDQRGRPLHPRD